MQISFFKNFKNFENKTKIQELFQSQPKKTSALTLDNN